MPSLVHVALGYASQGYAVLPLVPGCKVPISGTTRLEEP